MTENGLKRTTLIALVTSLAVSDANAQKPVVHPPAAVHIHGENTLAWTARWFSPDSERIWNLGLSAWATADGEPLDTQRLKTTVRGIPIAMDVCPDGRWIAVSTCPLGAITVWDTQLQRVSRTLRPRDATARMIRFVAGHRIAVWYPDPPLLLLLCSKANAPDQAIDLGQVGSQASISRNGRFFAMSIGAKQVVIWNVEGRRRHHALHCAKRVLSFSFDTDARRIVTGSADNEVNIWSVETGKRLQTLIGHGQGDVFLPVGVYSVAFDPDGNRVASGGHDGKIKIWDAASGDMLKETRIGSQPTIMSLSFSPNGRLLLAGYLSVGVEDGFCIWKLARPKKNREKTPRAE